MKRNPVEKKTKRVRVPYEVFMRLDDVGFSVPDYLNDCNAEQRARVIEESKYLIEMLSVGQNWYDEDNPLVRYNMKRSCERLLAAAQTEATSEVKKGN
jgi:hypothetical protein